MFCVYIFINDDKEVGLLQTQCVFLYVYMQSPSLQKSYRNIIPVGRGMHKPTNADSQLTTQRDGMTLACLGLRHHVALI